MKKDIEKTNQEYLDNQKELADSIDNTIKAVEEGEETSAEETAAEESVEESVEESKENVVEEPVAEGSEEEAPTKKKASLQGLLDSAKKLKK